MSEKPKIILNENEKMISNDLEVSEIFNNFFTNVAADIGKDYIFDAENHPSLEKIKERNFISDTFTFQPTSQAKISKIIDNFNIKKATGADKISVKLLKFGKQALIQPITNLVNFSISTSSFPDKLKLAQVTPLFKKNDALLKTNYRPVSVLPIPSKIFEKVLFEQLSCYFDEIFNNFLCAFRKGYGCQTTLLRLLEDWRQALDNKEYTAAILMDLSKAFDCLPHEILLSKLTEYGLSEPATDLLQSYLSNRKQQIKIGSIVSSWADICKGVPQGSILGPLLFNVFINDIFYFIQNGTLYNYADDNTLSFHSPNFSQVIQVLQDESNILIEWFRINKMQANPDKFQAIAVGKKSFSQKPVFQIGNTSINCEETVKLLGIDIDYKLNFESHISNICIKAGRQLNILKRIGKNLTKLNKLTIFHTFILSNFNFCPMAWHFCTESSTKKMEKLQERALRFIYDDYTLSYTELLHKVKMPSLHIRRMRTMAIETFRILNGIAPVVLSDLVVKRNSSINFRYSNILHIPRVNTTTYGKHSFRYAAPVLWNSLPDDFRSCTSFNHFKNLMQSWNGSNCKCAYCSTA